MATPPNVVSMDEYRSSDDGEGAPENRPDAPTIDTFKKWFKKDAKHSATWRKEAREDYDFVAGHQWSEQDRSFLREQMRPIITFNRISPVVRAVAGYEITNRQEVRYLPREVGDVAVNEVLTSAAEWFRDECGAEDEESDAFLDAVICGMGWSETRLEFASNPDGEPRIERIDPLEMIWDCNAVKRNLDDARRIWRVRKMTLGEAKDMFPEAAAVNLNAKWAKEVAAEDGEPNDGDPRHAYLGTDSGGYSDDDDYGGEPLSDEKLVTIVHVQWIESATFWRVLDPMSGQVIEASEEQAEQLRKRMPAMGVQFQGVKQRRNVRKQAFLGKIVLEAGPTPCPDQFSFQAMTGYRDRNSGTWYGMVRLMKDPQRWANKWLSQTLHILNSTAKGGVTVEEAALGGNKQQFLESWAKSEAVTVVPDGALQNGRIQPKPQGTFPTGFVQLMEFGISSIRDVSGVSLEMLGIREGDQPASLEASRKQTGMAVLATLFDGLRRYRKSSGRLLLWFITNSLSDGRLVRIVGDDYEQFVPLTKQEGVKEYDVIVEDSPSNPNQKEAIWAFLAPMFSGLPPQIQLPLLEYSPLPKAVVEKIKKAGQELQQQQSQPDPEAQAKVKALEAKAAKDMAEAQNIGTEPQMEQQKLQMQAQAQMAQTAMKAQGDRAKAQGDLAVKQAELQQQMAIERQKLEAEIALEREKQDRNFELRMREMQLEAQLKAAQMQYGINAPGDETNVPRAR